MLSPPSGRRGSGGGGWQAGGVVVPAGAGLVASAPCGPAEAEGEAGAADEACFPVAGQALDAGGLGGGQPDRGDAGRAGLAADGGQRRGSGVDLQVIGAGGLADGGRGVAGGGRCRGEDVSAGERGLDGGGPQLGQRGQRGVPADRVVRPGLALVPAEGVLPRLESYFYWPAAACDRDEIGHGRGTAFRRPAQVEGVLVLVPVREAADQQELPRVRGPDERPVAVAGAFRPVPAGPPLEDGTGYGLVSADDLV